MEDLENQLDEIFAEGTVSNEQYDAESMLEYIEQLETQLDEIVAEQTETGNPFIQMIDSLMVGELTESNALFYDLVNYKIAEKLDEKRIDIAQSIFGESKDEDDDADDETNSHPLVQLKKIASAEENTAEKYPEVTASGEVDKRSARALADRKEKGISTAGVPKFKHANGEESSIHPHHAKQLVDVLSGSNLKPDTKKQVLDHIHGSKAGLDKVSKVLVKS